MLTKLAKYWWMLALRGIAAIIFGILALIWPSLTILTLVMLFGAYALVDGIVAVVNGIASHEKNKRWWAMLLAGLAGIIFGLLTFFWPGVTALALLYLIAVWALVTGILHIIAAIHLRRIISGEWMLIISGIAWTIFGLYLVIFPGSGALSIIWLIGAYSIVLGIWLTILAFRIKGMAKKPK